MIFHIVALALSVSEDLHHVLAGKRELGRHHVTLWSNDARLDGAGLVHWSEKSPQHDTALTVEIDDVVQSIRYDHMSERVDTHGGRLQ